MIFKKLILKNVQRHKDLTVHFTPGLNVIRGANQRGKSTIIRSLFWLFTNRPLGNWIGDKKATEKLNTD